MATDKIRIGITPPMIRKAQMPGKQFIGFLQCLPTLLAGKNVAIMSPTTEKALETIALWKKFSLRCLKRDIIPQSNIYYRNWEITDDDQMVKYEE